MVGGGRYVGLMDMQHPTPHAAATTPRFLSTAEAAIRVGCTRQMLYNLRYYGLGPPVHEAGKRRLGYNESELMNWFAGLGGPIYQIFDWRQLAKRRRVDKTKMSA